MMYEEKPYLLLSQNCSFHIRKYLGVFYIRKKIKRSGNTLYPYSNGKFVSPLSKLYNAPYTQYTAPIRHFYSRRTIIVAVSVGLNRILWMEHVNWTRMTIISIVFGLPDLPFVQERLLQNATGLGNRLRPFYGDQIADRYAELIKEHLLIAA